MLSVGGSLRWAAAGKHRIANALRVEAATVSMGKEPILGIDRNRVRGIVHGTGSDLSRYATMKYIDMKDDVRENDLVVTSPESVFPTGYPIGRVVNVDDTGSLWKTADIELAVDPYRLDEVFLLRQAVTPVEELAGPAPEEPAQSVAPTTPDKRTLQDRYAP